MFVFLSIYLIYFLKNYEILFVCFSVFDKNIVFIYIFPIFFSKCNRFVWKNTSCFFVIISWGILHITIDKSTETLNAIVGLKTIFLLYFPVFPLWFFHHVAYFLYYFLFAFFTNLQRGIQLN